MNGPFFSLRSFGPRGSRPRIPPFHFGPYTRGMESPEGIFRDFLRERQLKCTSERLAILRAIQHFGRPFEAEELLLSLRESDYRVSKATIYRTLKHLLDAALIRQVFFGQAKGSYYDFVGGEGDVVGAHDHLLDLDTGKIIPFSNDAIVQLRDQIARKLGLVALSHRFEITARRPPKT